MSAVRIPVDDAWLATTGETPEALEREFRALLAAKLFELRRLTLAQAAEMAGLNLWQFTDFLNAQGIGLINLSPEELAHELSGA